MSASKIESLKNQIAKLQAKLAEAIAADAKKISADKLTPNTKITFNFGKGEAAGVLTGTVLGVVVPAEGAKGGTLVRILTGEGVNTRVVSVFVSAIVKIEADEAAA